MNTTRQRLEYADLIGRQFQHLLEAYAELCEQEGDADAANIVAELYSEISEVRGRWRSDHGLRHSQNGALSLTIHSDKDSST